MATSKSDERGGQRSKKRHATEAGLSGALAVLLISFFPEGSLSIIQTGSMTALGTGVFGWLAKVANENDVAGRLIRSVLPSILALFMLPGCAMNIGVAIPEQFASADASEVIISCELKGFQIAFFDAGICRNLEGGQVGDSFVDLFTGTIEVAGRILGGIFTGIGGIGSSIASDGDS